MHQSVRIGKLANICKRTYAVVKESCLDVSTDRRIVRLRARGEPSSLRCGPPHFEFVTTPFVGTTNWHTAQHEAGQHPSTFIAIGKPDVCQSFHVFRNWSPRMCRSTCAISTPRRASIIRRKRRPMYALIAILNDASANKTTQLADPLTASNAVVAMT